MSLNRNVFYTLLTQLPTSVFGFATGVFITRMLGPEGRGIYSLYQANIDLFTLFLGLSTGSAIVYYVANKKIALEKLVGIAIASLFLSTALLAVVLTAFVFWLDPSWVLPPKHDSAFYIGYLVVGFVTGLGNSYISAIFQGRSQFKVVNLVALANSCLNLALFGALFAFSAGFRHGVSVRGVLTISMLVFVMNLSLWLYFYLERVGTRPSFDFSMQEDVRPLMTFGLLLHLVYAINFLNYRLDVWIVNYYQGPEQLGLYSLAANVSQMIWLISAPIAAVLSPHLTSDDRAALKLEQFVFYSRMNCTCALLAVIAAFACAGYLLPRVYGAPFAASIAPFRLLLPGALFAAATKVFAVYTVAKNQIRFNLIAVSVGLLFTVGLDFALIPRIGIVGASIATTLSYTAILACILYGLFCKMGLPFGNYFLLTPADCKTVFRRVLPSGAA